MPDSRTFRGFVPNLGFYLPLSEPLRRDCWDKDTGFCIRCRKILPRNLEIVLCRCPWWQRRRSEQDRYCHLCGQDAATQIDDLLCDKCDLG